MCVQSRNTPAWEWDPAWTHVCNSRIMCRHLSSGQNFMLCIPSEAVSCFYESRMMLLMVTIVSLSTLLQCGYTQAYLTSSPSTRNFQVKLNMHRTNICSRQSLTQWVALHGSEFKSAHVYRAGLELTAPTWFDWCRPHQLFGCCSCCHLLTFVSHSQDLTCLIDVHYNFWSNWIVGCRPAGNNRPWPGTIQQLWCYMHGKTCMLTVTCNNRPKTVYIYIHISYLYMVLYMVSAGFRSLWGWFFQSFCDFNRFRIISDFRMVVWDRYRGMWW